MFVDARLAARIDRIEVRVSHAVAAAIDGAYVIEIGDGAAVFARNGSPLNKVIGAGFDGPLDEAVLARIERAWTEPVRVELAALASPDAAAQLGQRGYQLLGFENVLVRPLGDEPPPALDVRVSSD